MNTIDKIIRNKLSHHTAETPQGAWDNIMSRLPKEKKNFRPWWVFASALAIIFASVTAFLFFNGEIENNDQIIKQKIDLNGPVASQMYHKYKVEPKDQTNDIITSESGLNVQFTAMKGLSIRQKKPLQSNLNSMQSFSYAESKLIDFVPMAKDAEQNSELKENFSFQQIDNILENKLPKHNHNLFFKSKFQPKDQIICPSYKPGGKKKSVDFYVSHDYAPKSISAGTVENIPYENARRDTEHSLYSFSAGVRIGYQISDKWTLQSGMNYSQINERFQYIDPESNQTREITIKDYIYQNGKIVDSVINTQTVTIPGDTQIKINNNYRTFDIPILGKYTILESNRFIISAVAGVYLNIVSATKGMILDNDGKSVINISESADRKEVFKSNIGLSTFGALSIAYHISPSIDLFAEPNARFQTRSITSETYPLSQRFNTYGLLTGVRYNF